MSSETHLPTRQQLQDAISIYLNIAYGQQSAPVASRFSLDADTCPREFLLSDRAERTPDTRDLDQVRSFALRLGNSAYPNMKLRMSRPPKDREYLFSVDCHDEMLKAPAGSADHEALEELKRHNAQLAEAITAAWDNAGLATERTYLRRKIEQARRGDGDPSRQSS
jgi:hypothetical protein